jgi:hypothetical protein
MIEHFQESISCNIFDFLQFLKNDFIYISYELFNYRDNFNSCIIIDYEYLFRKLIINLKYY